MPQTNMDETKPNRQNRTVTLHLGNTLAEYESIYLSETGLTALIRRVEIADSLDWGCLANGHEADCPHQLHFTHYVLVHLTRRAGVFFIWGHLC